jgi:branched-subunit amino acid aminotransferase/4-amino-4-deoxychorismate lyase
VYRPAEGLVSPPRAEILPGITLGVVRELAGELGLAWVERPVEPAELTAAAEVLLTSTPYGVLPATRIDGRPVGDGAPGDVCRGLLAALGRRMGIDLAEQARRFATR